MDPDGRTWPGAKSIDAVVERLREAGDAAQGPGGAALGLGLDPIYFGERRVRARGPRPRLDDAAGRRAARERPHPQREHEGARAAPGCCARASSHPGVPLGADGLPTGELKGPDAMMLASSHVGFDREVLACDELGLRHFAQALRAQGRDHRHRPRQPAAGGRGRHDAARDGRGVLPRAHRVAAAPAAAQPRRRSSTARSRCAQRSTDRLRLGLVKIVADGSIQGFSARLRWPGYYNGAPNGLWYIAPEQLREAYRARARARRAGAHAHQRRRGHRPGRSTASRRRCARTPRPTTASRCSTASSPTRRSSGA